MYREFSWFLRRPVPPWHIPVCSSRTTLHRVKAPPSALGRQWPGFVPEPHFLSGLVWDNVQRMEGRQSVALFKDIILCANRRGPPGECRGEHFARRDTRIRAIVVVLCRAQAREDIAGVVRIRTPWCHGQLHLHANPRGWIAEHSLARFVAKTAMLRLTASEDISVQSFTAEEAADSGRRSAGRLWLPIQSRLQQGPAPAYPMAVASIHQLVCPP